MTAREIIEHEWAKIRGPDVARTSHVTFRLFVSGLTIPGALTTRWWDRVITINKKLYTRPADRKRAFFVADLQLADSIDKENE